MDDLKFEDVIDTYLRRMNTEGRIPESDKIHQDVEQALARIMK